MKWWEGLPFPGASAKIRGSSLLGALLALSPCPAVHAATPVFIAGGSGRPGMMVYPPDGDAHTAPPMTVMLHGMCGSPENECSHFASSVTKDSWLICPRATIPCANGGATWSHERRSESVEAAVEEVVREYPDRVDTGAARTLIGFSLGAFVALDLAHHDAGRWQRLILIGAKLDPDARALKENGVLRVLLASGDFDLSRSHMMDAARSLSHAGTESTFMSLGKVGHRFAKDMDEWLETALGWVRGPGGRDTVARPVPLSPERRGE